MLLETEEEWGARTKGEIRELRLVYTRVEVLLIIFVFIYVFESSVPPTVFRSLVHRTTTYGST